MSVPKTKPRSDYATGKDFMLAEESFIRNKKIAIFIDLSWHITERNSSEGGLFITEHAPPSKMVNVGYNE